MSESPWSKEAPPSVILPPPPMGAPPAPPPAAAGAAGPVGPRRWQRAGAALRVVLVVAMAAAVGSTVTFLAMRSDHVAGPASAPAVSPLPSQSPPQFSSAEVATAKQNLCHVVDLSVGQKGEGGFRVQGNLNVPVTLKAVNSAVAVQNALVPATPPDTAAAAKKYVSTTLDVTTAAMGNSPTPEVNRLTDISNNAIYALLDACGLPR